MSLAELEEKRKHVARLDGLQVLVLLTERGIFACTNRCPHEGYPLSEGECTQDGRLRCHWHNWTFDLASGDTLVGGDRLVQYLVNVVDGRILIAPPPADGEMQQRVLDGVHVALDDADHARLLRETIRLERAGGDRDEALRAAIAWLAPRLQYGTTHAIGGAADWLALADAAAAPEQQLAAIGEILGHIADDGRREGRFPYAQASVAWRPRVFAEAIEAQDEATALAHVRGALAAGLRLADLVPTLAAAALQHYADFGHSLIYVVKSAELSMRLGAQVDEPLLCMLVRSMCYATREDLVPEFRGYRAARERWQVVSPTDAAPARLQVPADASVSMALDAVVAWSAHAAPDAIFRALVDAAVFVLLHVDERWFTTTTGTIAKNATWLNFTHALTFADAGARVAAESPELWPDVLLQLACFIGRSNGFIDASLPIDTWMPDDATAVRALLRDELFDHGRDRFIVSVHLTKTLFAADRLIAAGDADADRTTAALARFFHAPMKGRHVLRTARQMLAIA